MKSVFAVAAGGVGPPPLVTTVTVIVCAWSGLRVTVKVAGVVPEFPSTTFTSATSMVTVSSSVIVPSPRLSEIVGPVLPESTTPKVSFGSSMRSPTTDTARVWVVVPAVNVRVPDPAR